MDHSAHQNRRLLFYTLCLAYISNGMISILPGPALSLLAAHTGVSLDIAGWIFTASAGGFSLGVIISGNLSTRLNAKYLLMIGVAFVGAMALVIPWTHIFVILLIAQLIMGIGFGCMDVSINIIITLAFHATLNETLNNIHGSFGVGALLGPLLLSLSLRLLNEMAWAFSIGFVIALITILLLAWQQVPTLPEQNKTELQHTTATSRKVLTQTVVWLMALQMFLYVGAEVGFGSWIVTVISQGAKITLVVAAPAATLFWFGLTGGRLFGAQLLKYGMLSEDLLLYLCFIGSGTSGLLVAIFPGSVLLSFTLCLLFGFFLGPVFPNIMAMASRRFVHALGTVSSLILFSAGASGIILPALIGIIITHIGISWGIAVPALVGILITIPFYLAARHPSLQFGHDMHTMEEQETTSTVGE